MTAPELLDATFAALADPTRRAILARLSAGEATVTELAAPFRMSQPAVSKHLKVLERAGLVSRGRDAQRRPCRLEALPLKAALDWLVDYRDYWAESYQRLDSLLDELQAEEQRLTAGDVDADPAAPSGHGRTVERGVPGRTVEREVPGWTVEREVPGWTGGEAGQEETRR